MATAISEPRTARRWTGEDLDRMIDAGIIREGTGAYLWDGEIIEPMAEDQPHYLAVKALRKLLESRFPEAEWSVNPSQPVDLREGFRPQPDLVVLRGPDSQFAGRGNRPSAADVALLVEVSGSTYADDKGEYLREYARAGIPQYWIVNLAGRCVEVYTEPVAEEGRYESCRIYGAGESVPVIVPDVEFEGVVVGDMLRNVGQDEA
jgi:Uma2 family endonuclease